MMSKMSFSTPVKLPPPNLSPKKGTEHGARRPEDCEALEQQAGILVDRSCAQDGFLPRFGGLREGMGEHDPYGVERDVEEVVCE